MRKLTYHFLSYFLIATVVSCTMEKKEKTDVFEDVAILKSKTVITQKTESAPVSRDMSITPYLIPGTNNGGNRTCEEVGYEFADDEGYFDLCGEKVDYELDDNGVGSFAAGFPASLEVTVDGNYISFDTGGCLEIEGNNYMVGAVIVKGSNHANVYFYPEGAYNDSGLAAPEAENMVSNLTFCFIPCEQSELVIALKTIMTIPIEWPWAYSVSGGQILPNEQFRIGYNNYILGIENVYPLLFGFGRAQIGTITAKDYMENDIHYLEVIIDTYRDDWSFLKSHLYIGSLDGLKEHLDVVSVEISYLNYQSFPFFEDENSGIRIFKIPFSDIIE